MSQQDERDDADDMTDAEIMAAMTDAPEDEPGEALPFLADEQELARRIKRLFNIAD